jgi:hypothetical protein
MYDVKITILEDKDNPPIYFLLCENNIMVSQFKAFITKSTKIRFNKTNALYKIENDKFKKCEQSDRINTRDSKFMIKNPSDIVIPTIPTDSMCRPSIIYLIRTREYIDKNEHIYKIGRTTQQANKRLASYSKGSELHFAISVLCNVVSLETSLKQIFIENFDQCLNIGTEYFKGDPRKMIKIIYDESSK